MQVIDCHHHLWNYSAEQYPWIGPDAGVLKKDFLLPDLQQLSEMNDVHGFVAVHARQSLEDTHWLLELAKQSTLIRGVVGWVPLRDHEQLSLAIESLSGNKMLKGIRHVIQDEPDDRFILGDAFNRGIEILGSTEWVYDILIYAKHLANTIEFVDRHPEQPFVLDHIAKPSILADRFDHAWANHIKQLGKRPNVSCKFSGVASEVRDASWNSSTIRPYWDVAIEAFGVERLMYASDWPVCLLKTDYSRWKETVGEFASELTNDEQAAFWSGNATRIYRLG